jgi:hexokinase
MTSLRAAIVTAIKSLIRGKSLIQAMLTFWIKPDALQGHRISRSVAFKGIDEFLKEAEKMLVSAVDEPGMMRLCGQLKVQFRDGLWSNPACMLPSYNYQLPTGDERGHYLAVDVGGSNLRVALVELSSRGARGSESTIVRMDSCKIDATVKALRGSAFFDWMADRILETISQAQSHQLNSEKALPMGLAWSFPIEYVVVSPCYLYPFILQPPHDVPHD